MVSNQVQMPQSELTEAFTMAAVDAVELLRKLSDGREIINQNHVREIQESLTRRFAEMYFHTHKRVKDLGATNA